MSMTTNYQLIKLAEHYGINLHVCSKDKLASQKHSNPGYYIINLADSDKPGTHWVALFIDNATKIYFDSYGMLAPEEVEEFLMNDYYYNKKQIQSLQSGFCGIFCIAFLLAMHRLKKKTKNNYLQEYQRFINQFSDNPTKNLRILKTLE